MVILMMVFGHGSNVRGMRVLMQSSNIYHRNFVLQRGVRFDDRIILIITGCMPIMVIRKRNLLLLLLRLMAEVVDVVFLLLLLILVVMVMMMMLRMVKRRRMVVTERVQRTVCEQMLL